MQDYLNLHISYLHKDKSLDTARNELSLYLLSLIDLKLDRKKKYHNLHQSNEIEITFFFYKTNEIKRKKKIILVNVVPQQKKKKKKMLFSKRTEIENLLIHYILHSNSQSQQ